MTAAPQSAHQRLPVWLAGGSIALALGYHLVATAAYPNFFRSSGWSTRQDSWPLGWPLEFAILSVTGQFHAFQPLALFADLLVAAVLILGTALAAADWSPTRITLPGANRKLLVVILASIGCWAALVAKLGAPLGVFLGWVALAIVYLGVPCAVYAIVTRARSHARFSLRTLLAVMTGLCVLLAILTTSDCRQRPADSKRARIPAGEVTKPASSFVHLRSAHS
jgi:hypothetical protein